ncbi:Vps62-related protein [Pelodictyon luteolum]|nr:Vps62-related protein [Pelodictyon luteolum]
MKYSVRRHPVIQASLLLAISSPAPVGAEAINPFSEAISQKIQAEKGHTPSSHAHAFMTPTNGLFRAAVPAAMTPSASSAHAVYSSSASWHSEAEFLAGARANGDAWEAKGLVGPEIKTMHLRLRYAYTYDFVYNDRGSGAKANIAIWRPRVPDGWVRLGDYAQPGANYNESQPTGKPPCLIVMWDDRFPQGDSKNAPYLKPATGFTKAWDDTKTHGKMDGSFWVPISAKGYAPVGCVANGSHSAPADLNCVYTVNTDLLTWTGNSWIGQIWTDRKSGGVHDCALWAWKQDSPSDKILPGIPTNSFWAVGSYTKSLGRAPGMILGLKPDIARSEASNALIDTYRRTLISGVKKVYQDSATVKLKLLEASVKARANEAAGGGGSFASIASDSFISPELNAKIKALPAVGANGGTTVSNDMPTVSYAATMFTGKANQIAALGRSVDLGQLPGFDSIMQLKGVTVTNASFSQGSITSGKEKGQPWMCLSGDVTISTQKFGSVSGKVVALSRLYQKEGLRTGYVISVPSADVTSKLPAFGAPPLNAVKFSDAAITFGQEAHSWEVSELPTEVKDLLSVYVPTGKEALRFPKGENVWLVSSVAGNSLFSAPFSVLDAAPPKVLFSAIFPDKPADSFKLRAKLLSSYKAAFLPHGIKIDTPDLEISSGPFNGVTLWSNLHIDLSKQFQVDLPARIDIPVGANPLAGISVSGLIPGSWKNPMGLKGLELDSMRVGGTFGGVSPSLGLGGILDLGQGWKFDLAGSFSFASPVALSGMSCSLDRDLSLGDLVSLYGIVLKAATPSAQLPAPSTVDLPLANLKVMKPSFAIAEFDIPAMNLRQGLTFDGGLSIGTAQLGSASVWMLAGKGLDCKGWISPFSFGPFKVSGNGKDKLYNTRDDAPYLDLEYTPKTAYSVSQHCYLSGRTMVAGAPMNIQLNLGKDNLAVDIDGKLGGLFDAHIGAQGTQAVLSDISKGGSLAFQAEMRNSGIDALAGKIDGQLGSSSVVKKAIDLVGGGFAIRSVQFSGTLDGINAGAISGGSVKASAFGRPADISFSATNVPGLESLVSGLMVKKVESIAMAVLKDPLAFFGNVCTNMGDLGTDVLSGVTSKLQKSPTQYFTDAQTAATSAGDQAYQAASAAATVAKETADKAARAAEQAAKKMAETLKKIAEEAWKAVRFW